MRVLVVPHKRYCIAQTLLAFLERCRVLAVPSHVREAHEGGVDSASMSAKKIASIVARMQSELRPPRVAEGFDEVLLVGGADSEAGLADQLQGGQLGDGDEAVVLARVHALACGEERSTFE